MLPQCLSLSSSLSPSLLWFYCSNLPKILQMLRQRKLLVEAPLPPIHSLFIVYSSEKNAGDLCIYIWNHIAENSCLREKIKPLEAAFGTETGVKVIGRWRTLSSPFCRLVQSWVCCLWEQLTPALLVLKRLPPRDRQPLASFLFCWSQAGPGGVCQGEELPD